MVRFTSDDVEWYGQLSGMAQEKLEEMKNR